MLAHLLRMSCLVSVVAIAAACGSDSVSGSLTFGNTPPVFTSPSSVSVAEDTAGAFYTAAATDMNNDAVTFRITGGDDQEFFNLTGAGALSFVTPPDFENPQDTGADNTYRVALGASDSTSTTQMTLTVTVTDRDSLAFRVRRVVQALASPVFIAPVPDGSGRMYVVELAGRIRILSPGDGTIAATDFLDLRGQVSTSGERGLLGFATSPDFPTSGQFYVFLTDLVGTIEVRRYTVSASNRDIADTSTMRVILRQPHPLANHNGGWIGFDGTGYLHVAIGDGGGSGDPDDNAQNPDTWLGKILRIDITRDAFPNDPTRNYAVPVDNPFASAGGAPEVWALGLRNPFRASFDFGPFGTGLGALIIGDVGQDTVEEVDVMLGPEDNEGVNFGWAQREGTRTFKGPESSRFRAPAAEYLHGSGPREGATVIGGVVYRGPVERLRGEYIFADFIEGNVWSIPIDALFAAPPTVSSDNFTLRNADFTPDAGAINNPVAFGTDQGGNVYIVDLDGEVFAIEGASASAQPAPRQAARSRANASTTRPAPKQHWCIEAWDGHTVRWIDGNMVLAGQGFACVRKHYDRTAEDRRADLLE
ncbi:PQQ-dependent sugar dehydrogenase [Lysobacter sp. A6]|uniref:PQQ-dependent sugar dehydrogenase n=1 Tax=Noviluteimonas lactosilytica TaxID=2888523 RepID=A0ABS8JH65_9GAMM|nr:PQQ-dependent sugar dehydrogenase [Lysobacter lactosilyticus]MCC8362946.1 PQQ-dependent sugar dehydrogenase [Lysobacter lactosilyticus]